MSHIPNNAMPHAGTIMNDSSEQGSGFSLSRLAGKVRENPGTLAAGATLIVGAVAAAVFPALRARAKQPAKAAPVRSRKSSPKKGSSKKSA